MTTQCVPFRFTNNAIDALINQKEQVICKDTQLTHLGILVGARTKSFFIQASDQGRPIRHSLGRFPFMSVEETRKKGVKVLGEIFDGQNPNVARRAEKSLLESGPMGAISFADVQRHSIHKQSIRG